MENSSRIEAATIRVWCHLANKLSRDNETLFILVVCLILAPLSLLVNIPLLICLVKNKTFHINVRLLLISLILFTVSSNIVILVKHCIVMAAFLMEPCVLVIPISWCKCYSSISILLGINTMFSFLALSVERLYASFFYRTYAETKNCFLALILMIILYSLSSVMELISLIHTVSQNDGNILCDSTISGSSSSAIFNFIICVTSELVAIIAIVICQYRDKVKLDQILWFNTAQHSLKARFQLSSNLNLNKALLPCIITYFVASVLSSMSIFLAIIYMDIYGEGRHKLGHFLSMLSLIYSLIQGILLLSRNPALENAWLKMMFNRGKWRRNKVGVNNLQNEAPDHNVITEKYFDELAVVWNTAARS